MLGKHRSLPVVNDGRLVERVLPAEHMPDLDAACRCYERVADTRKSDAISAPGALSARSTVDGFRLHQYGLKERSCVQLWLAELLGALRNADAADRISRPPKRSIKP